MFVTGGEGLRHPALTWECMTMWRLGEQDLEAEGQREEGSSSPWPLVNLLEGSRYRNLYESRCGLKPVLCLPLFLPYPPHPQFHKALENIFNVFQPLLKEGTGQSSVSLHPQLLRTPCWSSQETIVSSKVKLREERRAERNRVPAQALQLALSATRGGAAAMNQPPLCRALWASQALIEPWLCPQGWEPWAWQRQCPSRNSSSC